MIIIFAIPIHISRRKFEISMSNFKPKGLLFDCCHSSLRTHNAYFSNLNYSVQELVIKIQLVPVIRHFGLKMCLV